MALPTPLNFLITGAGRGIGRGLGRLLRNKGHRIFLLDFDAEELKQTSKILRTYYPGTSVFGQCDLRNPSDIKAAAEDAHRFFDGKLHVLINNAANTSAVGATPFENLSLEEWNASIETNLTAPMLMSQACLPMLKQTAGQEHGGCIIHMSSTRAHQSEPNSEGYAATKAGLIGLTHAMATSLAPVGIRVNAILPGWIHVGNENKEADEKGVLWEEGLRKEDHEWHLSGRVGKVEDVLKAVEYVVGARFVNGAEIVVDGGVTRKMVYPE